MLIPKGRPRLPIQTASSGQFGVTWGESPTLVTPRAARGAGALVTRMVVALVAVTWVAVTTVVVALVVVV